MIGTAPRGGAGCSDRVDGVTRVGGGMAAVSNFSVLRKSTIKLTAGELCATIGAKDFATVVLAMEIGGDEVGGTMVGGGAAINFAND